MKRSAHVFGLLLLTGLLAGVATAQDSLGDAARLQKHQREGKPVAAKVFTNDNLPGTETISTVGVAPSETASDATAGGQPAASDTAKNDANGKPEDPVKERQKVWEEWRNKIQTQKAAIEQLQKDIDESEKLHRMAQVTNTANNNSTNTPYDPAHVYNGAEMVKEEAAFHDQIELKKKAIEDGKQKVEDLQEEARRAGVPSGFRD
jgi:hypothetical protein